MVAIKMQQENTPWEKDTLVNVFSVTKGVTAACVAMLVDQRKIRCSL